VTAETQVDSPRMYVRAVLAEHPDADVYELAQLAATAVEDQDLRPVLALAMVEAVRAVVGSRGVTR